MATLVQHLSTTRTGDRFLANLALVMCIVTVSGFALMAATGRSSFHAPLPTHLHAIGFMGWVALFIAQSRLGVGESRALHRRLGWIAAGWAVLLVVLGCGIIVSALRRGVTPFFFQPQYLMFGDPFTLFGFAGITYAAIRLRKRTDWHGRLHLGAMTMLVPPGIGRLLPLPLMQPWAFEGACAAALIFPLAGMIRDKRHFGRVHPAWWAPMIMMPLTVVSAQLLAFSPIGDIVYREVVSGSPGAAIAGREYGTPPH